MSSASSARSYSIVEPHPSVPASHYYMTGRGGAGNRVKAPSTVTRGSDATGPAARISLTSKSSSQNRTVTTGRGGAGNVHPSSERAIFSFDEELERQLSQERHAAPVYHVGRGGAGNTCHVSSGDSNASRASGSERRRSSESGDSFASTASAESGADYLNRNLKKSLKKIWGH